MNKGKMIIWDGKDPFIFLDLIKAVLNREEYDFILRQSPFYQGGKQSDYEEKVVHVKTLSDLKAVMLEPDLNPEGAREGYVPQEKEENGTCLTWEEWDRILDAVMPSKDMREYLRDKKNQMYQKENVIEMIYGAPIPFEKKRDLMFTLSSNEKLCAELMNSAEMMDNAGNKFFYLDGVVEDSYRACYLQWQEASTSLLNLYDGQDVFCLKDKWWDPDFLSAKETGIGPFTSMDMAQEYIQNEMKEEEWGVEGAVENCWHEVEKWSIENYAKYYPCREFTHQYTYFLLNGEVTWYDRMIRRNDAGPYMYDVEDKYGLCRGRDLNLPVPFRPGDIVTIDCTPFAPKKHAVILEVGDNRDCCCLQALTTSDRSDHYIYGAVKHVHIFDLNVNVPLSALYRIEKYTGELEGKETVFQYVSDYLNGSDEAGRKLWNKLHDFYGLSRRLTAEHLCEMLKDEDGK